MIFVRNIFRMCIPIFIFFTTQGKAISEWNCQMMVVELNSNLKDISGLSLEDRVQKLDSIKREVNNIRSVCEPRYVNEDFDLDGADWQGLKSIEKKLHELYAVSSESNTNLLMQKSSIDKGIVSEAKYLGKDLNYGWLYFVIDGYEFTLADERGVLPQNIKKDDYVTIKYNPETGELFEAIAKPDDVSVKEETKSENKKNIFNDSSYISEEISRTVPLENETIGLDEIIVFVFFGLIVVTMILGAGENRKIIIFRDYDDVGLTFVVPASFVLLMMLVPSVGGEPKNAIIFAMSVSGILLLFLIRNTYRYNNGSILYTFLALITKVPLGVLWIIALLGTLNPSGNTAKKRRQSRGQALIILTLLTPLIMVFIDEKRGSLFNPKDWLKYKRVGNLRDHL